MSGIISAKRKNDAVITVSQNNQEKFIEIEELNKAAERLTGYQRNELQTQKVDKIFPENIMDAIDNYLDYEDFGEDLASVLRKVRLFKILKKNGEEIPVSLKVFYVITSDSKKPQFELLMRDTTLLLKLEELREKVVNNNNDELVDTNTGLIKENGVIHNLEAIMSFIDIYNIEASIAFFEVDNFNEYENKYGQDKAYRILKEVIDRAGRTLRKGDIMGIFNESTICLVLIDCNSDDITSVLKRLNGMITGKPIAPLLNNPKFEVKVTLSYGYMQLQRDINLEQSIEMSLDSMVRAINNGGNRMYEANQ